MGSGWKVTLFSGLCTHNFCIGINGPIFGDLLEKWFCGGHIVTTEMLSCCGHCQTGGNK